MSSGSQLFGTPTFDLSGKLIIKAQLGDDIRNIPIHNEEITYDELLLMMQRLFRGKIQNSDDVVIKYKDSDGDLITIFDSSDVSFAKSQSRFLKLTVFVNQRPKPLEHDQIKELKGELVQMRDKMNHLLSKLDAYSEEQEQNDRLKREVKETRPVGGNLEKKATALDNKVNASMFDPLKTSREDADSTTPAKDPFADVGVPKSSQVIVSSGSYASAGSIPSNAIPQAPQNQPGLQPTSSYQPQIQAPSVQESINYANQQTHAGPPGVSSQNQQYPQQDSMPFSNPNPMVYQDKVLQHQHQSSQQQQQQQQQQQGVSMSMGYDASQGYVVSSGSQPFAGGQPQMQPGGQGYIGGGQVNYPQMLNSDMNSPAQLPNQGYGPNQHNPYSRGMTPKTYPQPVQSYDQQYPGNAPMPSVPPGAHVPGLLYPH